MNQTIRIGSSCNPDRFQNTLTAKLLVHPLQIKLVARSVLVWLDATHVVHCCLIDARDQLVERRLELRCQCGQPPTPSLAGIRSSCFVGEQRHNERIGAGGHHRHHVGVQRILVLLTKAHTIVVDKSCVVANDEVRLTHPRERENRLGFGSRRWRHLAHARLSQLGHEVFVLSLLQVAFFVQQ